MEIIFFMCVAGLEVEFQSAALDEAQADYDLLVGREIRSGEIFIQRDGHDDVRTVDNLPQVAFEKLRSGDCVVLPGSTLTENRTSVDAK